MLHEEITSQIIAAFYAVYNQLGYGFLEKVYQNALFGASQIKAERAAAGADRSLL